MAAARTIKNLAVGKHTPCIFQGFTGKSATFHAKLSESIGTKIVGGVTPNKGGQTHLDKPVYDRVKDIVRDLKPHATAVFVPPLLAADAIIDAIENEIPLIVSVAEGVPVKDQMRIMAALHSQDRSRLVGCNSPGMMSPDGCRLGIAPISVAKPGPIGIASRSGTLSYEAAWSTRHLGQSSILGLGGDFYPGTRHAEALAFFMQDEATKGIVLVGEVGGVMEEEAAARLALEEYRMQDGQLRKPVVGFIAGRNVPPGQIFGHAGAIWRDGVNSAEQKRQAFRDAGILVVDAIGDVGPAIQKALEERGETFSS